MTKTSDFSDSEPSAFVSWQSGKGFHSLRKLIWQLADPNMDTYNPWRAITLLNQSIKDKWMAEQLAKTNMDIERSPGSELEALLPPPIVNNGEDGMERQLRDAVNKGMRYLSSPSIGTEPEYPHIIARQKLGFTHPVHEDTPEQSEAIWREELRIVHETCLAGAIYDLGEARDEQHLAYLQSHVDKHRNFLDRLDRGEVKSGYFDKPKASADIPLGDNTP